MRLLIVGTGARANAHAREFAKIDGVEIVGAVDVNPARVTGFASKYNIGQTFTSLQEAITWGEFDAAANVTSDKAHHPTTLALIAAGKHVLCEKPIAENYQRAAEMASAVERAGLVGMVSFDYRDLPALQRARELVVSGEIGRIRHFDASYLQSWLVSNAYGHWASEPMWLWRLSTKHGSSGVLGDVGIHILDSAAYVTGSAVERLSARLICFEKAPGNSIGEYDLDANDSFTMTAELENGAMGVIQASRWATGYLDELKVRLFGDKGALEVVSTPEGGTSLKACLGQDIDNAVWREIDVEEVPTIWQRFVEAVESGQVAEPSFRYAANLQKVVDLAVKSEHERAELTVSDTGVL
ncbi:MAG: Gfo/Idh/MocA family oxidoreductase [Mesorhizobium sp.]|uniref:Gfo/Idh/MocA family protein n=1 Tax=Mesorhizobium sp. TaxID=1871066 RepID=UPI000FE391C3|nr:Gfo/Idh/MocA family oxidoreductase [Mesorhizobium sp.]RWJ04410.1 MAG: Gfo/Idh/MocA family oxidoreductase [Mesorhizobium sp.]RWJ15173.1 MAG: Gfo/Idh/MocA family oxidoreductase [Mesorhizobium sp.]